jgi:hypothetical protein
MHGTTRTEIMTDNQELEEILLSMPLEMKARLEKVAAEKGMTVNDWLLAAIDRMLAARDASRTKRGGPP